MDLRTPIGASGPAPHVPLDFAAAILNIDTEFKMRRDDGQKAAAWRGEGRGGTPARPPTKVVRLPVRSPNSRAA